MRIGVRIRRMSRPGIWSFFLGSWGNVHGLSLFRALPPGSTFVGDPQQAIATHVIMHVVAGKVTRLFGIFDEAGLLRQLGVLPTN
jgi:hypothetical protein